MIAEFASVVEAVRCAVEIQELLTTENHGVPHDKQMRFRIGINLGDVMIDKDDLYGDGVNVAQRLQAAAEPGGIMVSGTVYSLVHKQLALAFDFAGDQRITDAGERVPSYSVRMSGRNEPEAVVAEAAPKPEPPRPEEAHASPSAIGKAAAAADGLLAWLKYQPKRVRRAATVIGILFVINVFADGLSNPWFLYPSVPLGLYIYWHYRRGQDATNNERRISE